jgi:hypothetical protein
VQAKDATKIFEFVRDAIATYPPAVDGLYGCDTITRWGTKATLRGGAGTPREKAELLVALYKRAGFDAAVVAGQADPAKIDGHQMLLRTYPRSYAPPITSTQAADWAKALGHDTLKQFGVIDADGAKAKALSTSLLGQLPPDSQSPFDFTLGTIPLVRVTIAGVPTYANPLVAGAKLGDSLTTDTPQPAAPADAPQSVHIKLEAARSDAPYTRFPLIEGTYAPDDVVGRRIQIAFPPPVDQKSLLGMRALDVETVVPTLFVAGPDMTQAERDKLSFAGDLFSLGGAEYAQTAGGLTLDGAPIAEGTTDPAAIAKVTQVKATPNGSAFPRVSVTVSALDAAGKNVPQLGASAFTVREDGQPMSFSLTRNEMPAPRVVLLYDTSTSIPSQFLGAGAVDVGNQIVQPLYAKYPAAQVRVAGMAFGATWLSSSWATTLADAQAQVASLAAAPGDSTIWEAVRDAETESPTIIVLVTDGDASDATAPEIDSAIAAGVPVFSVAVGTVKQPVLDRITTLSGGKTVAVTQLADAANAALAEIDARSVEDYRLWYQAPKAGAATRNVTVEINAKTGAGSYTVPAQPVIPKALSGLYLTVELGGIPHTTTLAGFGLGYDTAFPALTQAMLDDVHAALLGGTTLAVEGAGPSPSVVLDELIAEKLTLRPLVEALEAKDDAKVAAALAPGLSITPAKLLFAQPALVDAYSKDALTFETRPRVAALTQKAQASGKLTQALDLFPLSQWATAADDPKKAFQRTLGLTAGLAVMEAELFGGPSTLESLQGKPLTLVDPLGVPSLPGLTEADKLAWAGLTSDFSPDYRLLVPPTPGAFWAVDTKTGTVIGILPGGSGGGAEDVCNDYDYKSSVTQIDSLLGSFLGGSVGPWAALVQMQMKYSTVATPVLGYASAGGATTPATSMACGGLSDWLGNPSGPTGQLHGGFGTLGGTVSTVNPTGAHVPTLCGGVEGYDPCQGT